MCQDSYRLLKTGKLAGQRDDVWGRTLFISLLFADITINYKYITFELSGRDSAPL